MAKKLRLNGPVVSGSNAWFYSWLRMDVIDASTVAKFLEESGGDDVEIYINSGGGSVFAGSEIYTLLKDYAGKVTAKVTGIAASAASVIISGADVVMISPTGQIMIHPASTSTWGNKDDHELTVDMLDMADRSIANAYILRTGMTQSELLSLMRKETWMDAKKAIELKFADEIMFDHNNELGPSNSTSIEGEIPQAVIDKLRNELLKNGLMGNLDDFNLADLTVGNLQNNAQASAESEGEEEIMNLDELKNKHPELYNEIFNLGVAKGKEEGTAEGVKNERERIKDIEDLAAPGNESIIADAKASGATAMDTFKKIVAADKARREKASADQQADADASQAAKVIAAGEQEESNDDDNAKVKSNASDIVAQMKKLRGEG